MKNLSALCFPFNREKNWILFGLIKRGFGKGKINGFWGRISENEDIVKGVIKKTKEESGLEIYEKRLKKAAIIDFFVKSKEKEERKHFTECHVFFASRWSGKPRESEKIKPIWCPISNLHYKDMWPGDHFWLPLVLMGKTIKVDVVYNHSRSDVLEVFCKRQKL